MFKLWRRLFGRSKTKAAARPKPPASPGFAAHGRTTGRSRSSSQDDGDGEEALGLADVLVDTAVQTFDLMNLYDQAPAESSSEGCHHSHSADPPQAEAPTHHDSPASHDYSSSHDYDTASDPGGYDSGGDSGGGGCD